MRKSYKVKITPEAVLEIQETINYYNKKRKSLGREFFSELRQDISKIKRNPFICSIRYDDVRWISMRRFPYAAHYTIEDKTITIQAVLSHYQNPDTNWEKRQ